jgi:hypothetical protein
MRRLTMSFCCGEYGAVRWRFTSLKFRVLHGEGAGGELASAISVESTHCSQPTRLPLESDDGFCGLILHREKGEPHVPRQVVDQ